jgi:YegS/Rv2252/BmrU family lipid kinase
VPHFHFILNPAAGRGKAGRLEPDLRKLLDAANVSYTIEQTSAPGQAVELASNAALDDTILVSAGGDGTLNEILNGISSGKSVLGIIPIGSGNDFAAALGIPDDLEKAVRILIQGRPRKVDVAEVNGRWFTNSVAIGIDGAVARSMNKAAFLPPSLAYHYGVMANLFRFRNGLIRWKSSAGSGEMRVNLASVLNGPTYGGGYRIAPMASIDDGLLDVVVVGDYGIIGRMMHLPKVKSGKHLKLAKVHAIRCSEIDISNTELMPMAIDGELVTDPADIIHVKVIPGGLSVISE